MVVGNGWWMVGMVGAWLGVVGYWSKRVVWGRWEVIGEVVGSGWRVVGEAGRWLGNAWGAAGGWSWLARLMESAGPRGSKNLGFWVLRTLCGGSKNLAL